MTEKNKTTELEYQLLTWGPCVAKLRITDEFKNLININISLVHSTRTKDHGPMI
jgi:hypothetical protein